MRYEAPSALRPAASGDARDDWHAFDDGHGRGLGEGTDVLSLPGVDARAEEREDRVPGGDPLTSAAGTR